MYYSNSGSGSVSADWGTLNSDNSTSTAGLGTFKLTFTGAGDYKAGAYLDMEIDQYVNSWWNETGIAHNTAAQDARLSWQFLAPLVGDPIDLNPLLNLDNSILAGPADMAVALLWNFSLTAGQKATITFNSKTAAPEAGFFLQQYDNGILDGEQLSDPASVFFSSSISVTNIDNNNPVPEPSTIVLLGAGLASLGLYARRRNKN
ncbi:PEP-CTERM sorting domain-containing protein [Geobacter pelophilus]|uniref:PEP-CTERM sorting domain-containing protein n=2 Tax=Geoanaerobacter pelophilus TaxID=60036 RepID=A0AAW4L9T6_9BACT|nr:PEP-CTERM sorting domain-containing protein [Geoanaerobacter pelophilus]